MGNSASVNTDLLPYPVTTTILKNLRLSDDVLNLIRAFPVGELKDVANISKSKWIFDKIFPLVVDYLPLDDVLQCRLVCRRWREVVNALLENAGLGEPDYSKSVKRFGFTEGFTTDPFAVRQPWVHRCVTRESELVRFQEEMINHPENPFVFRSVKINHQNSLSYWRNVEKFLEQFGKHIWKLSVSCYFAPEYATVIIQHLLKHTPNVKMLRFEFSEAWPMEPVESAKPFAAEDQFPALPHLTFIDWLLCEPFYRLAMPQYSTTLVQMRLCDSEFLLYVGQGICHYPQLKLLEVRVEDEGDLWELEQLEAPLRNLTIFSSVRIPLPIYLNACHSFEQTLECVNIRFEEEDEPFAEEVDDSDLEEDESWEFSKLTIIRLENPNPGESLDVLTKIHPGPKTLEIKTYWEDEPEFQEYQHPLFEKLEGESVQIHGFLDKMYESEIWEKLPEIQTISVDALGPDEQFIEKVYTRAGQLELAQANNNDENE